MKNYRRETAKATSRNEKESLSHSETELSTQAKLDWATLALDDSEERLRAILETAVEGIITIDERGTIESMNPAAIRIFGYTPGELIGKNVNVLMPSPYHEQHDGYLSNYRRTGNARIIGIGREVSGRHKDGTVFPLDLSVSEVNLSGRRLFTGFVRDITERKEAEKALSHFAAMVESSDDAIIGKTLDGHITSWNKGAEKIFGYTRKEMFGKHISILIPADRADEEPMIIERIKRGESVEHFETVRQRKDGKLIEVSVTISPIHDTCRKILGASKIARDITERKRLQKEILEISDREQRRIGQDLHDGLCQQLAGIELMSQALEQNLATKSIEEAERVGQIAAHIREAINHTRTLARGLSPVTLESEGLMAALHELAANTKKIFGVQCSFVCDPPVPFGDQAAASQLFRIAQEAVSNAIRHGKAAAIVIQLKERHGKIVVTVSDNGSGFPKSIPLRKGMGLRIMQSRAGMIGGTLVLDNNPSGGARVSCTVSRKIGNKDNHARKKAK